MTSEQAKDYLKYLLAAYAELMVADADYQYTPFRGSKMPLLLRTLQEEIKIAKNIAKKIRDDENPLPA